MNPEDAELRDLMAVVAVVAVVAVHGLLASPRSPDAEKLSSDVYAVFSYQVADAMLTERAKAGPSP